MALRQKRKRVILPLRTKIEILQKIDNGEKLLHLAALYGIGRATIHGIKQNREKILNYVNFLECRPGRRTMRSGEYPQVENALYKWFLESRAQNDPVTGDLIRDKAKCFYKEIMNKDDFKASDGWLHKFKRRFGIRLTNNVATNRLQETPPSISIHEQFLQKIQRMNLLPDQIYSASGSVLLWKLLPRETYNNVSRDQITFLHCSNSTAAHKLDLLFVGNLEESSVKIPTDLSALYKTQREACISYDILNEWFQERFVPSVSAFLETQYLPPKALLVITNLPNYLDTTTLESYDGSIQTMFLQQNMLIDEGISHQIKSYYKKELMCKVVNNKNGIHPFVSEYTLGHAMLSIASIWEKVIPNAIILSWKKIWPTHPLLEDIADEQQNNENKDFMVDTEFVEMACDKYIKDGHLTKDDVKYWLSQDYDEHLSADDNLISFVKTEDIDIKEDPKEWACADPICITHTDQPLSAIDTCIRWGEQNNIDPDDMVVLNRLRHKILANVAGNN